MAEEKKKVSEKFVCMSCKGKKVCSECGCGGHMGHMSYFTILRFALMILIIWMVFFLGLKIGEFKGMFEAKFNENNCMMHDCFYSQHYMMYAQPDQTISLHRNVSTTTNQRSSTTKQTSL